MQRTAVTTTRVLVVGLTAMSLAIGCASRGFVRQQDEATRIALGDQVAELASAVEQVQSDVTALEGAVEQHDKEIEGLSLTSREALERAIAAGKLAEGKFVYERVLTDEGVQFGFEKADLSEDARRELDTFAEQIRENDENVFVEIQGHTDSSGEESFNLALGEERAAAVRRYLSLEHGLPLHRMSVISYGEAAPIDDNGTREGRARNRRVSLVVLQ